MQQEYLGHDQSMCLNNFSMKQKLKPIKIYQSYVIQLQVPQKLKIQT